MIEKLECGYITSYIKDLLPEIDNYSHYKNKDIFRSLSAFELETLSSYPPTNNLSEKERQLVYVLDNLLSRGFPTFCSINLERDLSRIIRNDFNIQESAAQGAIKFSDSITNNQYKAKWIKSITDSLILFDQKFDPNKVFEEIEKKYNSENNITVSQEEKIFYCQILPNLIGLNISQLFEPQRKIETMLPANEAQNYFGQRVDFAIETVDIKVIIEIDGLQHFQDQVQMNLDNQRRNSLRNNGWKVIEITSREINEGLNEQNINELRNTIIDSDYLECLNQNETISFSSLSDRLIHIPLLVARFQKVLLWALKRLLKFSSRKLEFMFH